MTELSWTILKLKGQGCDMPDYLAIHDFAKRYRDIYKNHNTTESDVSDNFSEQCFELGFEMDCGKSFIDLFQSAPFYNPDALEEVIKS